MSNEKFSLYMDVRIKRRIKIIAVKEDTSVSQIVTKLLLEFMDDYEKKEKENGMKY